MAEHGTLQHRLLQAHAEPNRTELIALYTEAADIAEAKGHGEATGFYLTHAYVFALESGAIQAGTLHSRLLGLGCEE